MSDLVVVALVSVLGSVLVIITTWITASVSRNQQWAREDAVAKALAENTAKSQQWADSIQTTAEATLDVNRRSAEATAASLATLGEDVQTVHKFVNNERTEQLRRERDSEIRGLASLRQMEALTKCLGDEPLPATLTAIRAAELKIEDLTSEITKRDEITAHAAKGA